MITMLIGLLMTSAFAQDAEVVGERPYEMVWAGRDQDDHPPLVDFEDLIGWTVETHNAEASFERTREQQLFGNYVGKLSYRATGSGPEVRILPPAPVPIDGAFDAVTCWIYGNNWGWVPDPTTPQVSVALLFEDAQGNEFGVDLTRVRWREWFLCHRRLTPEQIRRVEGGGAFRGFLIRNGRNTDDRVIYLDSFAVFVEQFPPLEFDPRPERGIPMFPGQTVGTNTGPGRLPFPTRPETILPDNLTADFTTSLRRDGEAFVFTYDGADGRLEYRLAPETGTLGDLTARWEGRGEAFRPAAGGGVWLQGAGRPLAPERAEHLGTAQDGDAVVSRWRLEAEDLRAEVSYTYRLWGKSLVVDIIAPGGDVGEVRYGHAVGLHEPRVVPTPYLHYRGRPAVVVAGPADAPLFLSGNTDWYLSNASVLWGANGLEDEGVLYNGGARYTPKTDGERNDCYERFFITVSPRYEEVLPNIPNPESPWKHITGTRVWRAHGAGDRERDMAYWRNVHRWGMRQIVVTDHETMWRDGGESFTFRTRAAPGKGGDEGARAYSRFMQDELGFVYGPYNNFTDFAPVNEYWHVDMVNRTPDNQLREAWPRCHAPKPARAVEFCEKLSPINQEKFGFSTAYCDVHTAVAPWDRTDYDYRVPGAGTFGAVFYSYGEIMLLQKAAWDGPVYSEGNYHWMYSGLTDGNYAQDRGYDLPNQPWLVDFDLRKMHDLNCNFGMGNLGMFYGRDYALGRTRLAMDASIDRFLAATVAFGHPGFLVFEGGFHNALRSYYMLQQLHSRYCLASAEDIRYADEQGRLLDASAAIATGAYRFSQLVTRYSDGTVTVVNGSRDRRMVVEAYGRQFDLPPNGYAGWTEDGAIEVLSSDPDGHRSDYAATPDYIYVDGRDRFMRFERAAGNGIGICRRLDDGRHEVLLHEGAECGFAVPAARATALAEDNTELGPAEVRTARGMTYVMPVEGAFSYILDAGPAAQAQLECDRDEVVAGERVVVRGQAEHELQIPTDAEVGERVWRQFEGAWIDFTVVPLAYADVTLEEDELRVELAGNLPAAEEFTVAVAEQAHTLRLEPGVLDLVTIDLGPPTEETAELLAIVVHAGELRQIIERGMRVEHTVTRVADLAAGWQAGMRVRGEQERFDFGDTRATVSRLRMSCGDIVKDGIFMHPPWVGAVGYSFALYDPVTLPQEPPAAIRASVGKRDGSDLGDGILFKLAVVDEDGAETILAEQVVARHEWLPIEGDLSPWAGRPVRVKLISDVGEDDNSSGDWACWADMRIESLEPSLVRTLEEDTEAVRREPGSFPVAGLTRDDLRAARRGWIRYDGMGLAGTRETHPTFAILNGVEVGNMAPAGGRETEGIWSENVAVPLTEEAIATLDFRNEFRIRNPRRDWFKVRRLWIELELADGRRCSSEISTGVWTQPPGWRYAEGIGIPFEEQITVEIWFRR